MVTASLMPFMSAGEMAGTLKRTSAIKAGRSPRLSRITLRLVSSSMPQPATSKARMRKAYSPSGRMFPVARV
jgi:hypothetical protein